tara:strand:- start:982 stop:1257 length:276 start_codon:yes stop_codon:yes gene_type:complete
MNLKSKSTLLKTIITQADNVLTSIPTYDHDGMPIEDSCTFDTYIATLTDIKIKTEKGQTLLPIDIPFASALIYDEMQERRELPNGESQPTS